MPTSITLTVKSLAQSTSFFLSTLQSLDYVYRGRIENTIGFGLQDSPPDFWISQEIPGVPAGAAHVAFPATSQRNVQDFFIAALKAGGKCHGEPRLRDPATGYFSAAVIDFDGNSIEAVYRPDLLDEGYGSRPSSVSSVSSVSSKGQKAPTMVSRTSTAKQAPTEIRSVAPSHASKAPTSASRAPTAVSRSQSYTSKAPSAAPASVSRAQSYASRTPSSVSRSMSQSSGTIVQAPPGTQVHTQTTPSGEVITTILTEARGAINVAKELASHVRPVIDSSNSAPNVHTVSAASTPNSHKPSDTIVGTLLGVAAGAAIHYAYSKATENDKKREAEFVPRPNIARTNTEPSFANDDRMYYYHEYNRSPPNHPYAIEAPSAYGHSQYEPSRAGSQRYITMNDNDERLSDYTQARPRRRSSFSGIDVRSFTEKSRDSQASKSSRMLEAPPTSYRAPTAITMADGQSRASGRSRSKSRISSAIRAMSASGDSKASHKSRFNSDEDLRSARSSTSRRSRSRAPSVSERSDATTVKPIRPAPSSTSKAPSVATAKTHTSKASRTPTSVPLPASRAGTTVSASPTEYQSTHSKANKTVIGRMIENDRKSALTKSVVGKLEDTKKLNVTNEEVDPSDSVSQVSSVRSKRSSRR